MAAPWSAEVGIRVDEQKELGPQNGKRAEPLRWPNRYQYIYMSFSFRTQPGSLCPQSPALLRPSVVRRLETRSGISRKPGDGLDRLEKAARQPRACMKGNYRRITTASILLVIALSAACSQDGPRPNVTTSRHWSPEAAAAYLDQRASWWAGWQTSARDHETFCVSCHTALPYALSRPALRHALTDDSPSPQEQLLLDDVVKRVRLWDDVGPYYARQADASRGTEAVLNALILSTHDARAGRLSQDARLAFDNMWAAQKTTGEDRGAWSWLNFALQPWEAASSPYFGATLAALAVGVAPEEYRSTPAIQAQWQSLKSYLDREYATQSLFNRTVLLLASAKVPQLITPERRESIVAAVLDEQRADGGWSLSALNRKKRWGIGSYVRSWLRSYRTLVETKSDGYATGLVTYALQLAGTSSTNDGLRRGLAWLDQNQNANEGSWSGYSLNQERDPTSNIGRFMSDAATSYAVLALTQAEIGPASLGEARYDGVATGS